VRWSQENYQMLGVEMVFFGMPSIGGWRQENSSRFRFGLVCDLGTCLGEIMVVLGWRWFNL